MPDPLANDDILKTVIVGIQDEEFVLTVYFNGGPVTVAVQQFDRATAVFPEDSPKVNTFAADPFFRKANYYVTSGTLLFRFEPGAGVKKCVAISAQFTNMFAPGVLAGPAHYRLQLSSPTNAAAPRPVDVAGDLQPGVAQNVIVVIVQ